MIMMSMVEGALDSDDQAEGKKRGLPKPRPPTVTTATCAKASLSETCRFEQNGSLITGYVGRADE